MDRKRDDRTDQGASLLRRHHQAYAGRPFWHARRMCRSGYLPRLTRFRLRHRRDHLRRRRLRDSLTMTAIYRAEVIGSMLRPGWLKQARTDFAADRLSTAQFKRVEDRAVDEAIALQERSGVDVVTDGEMRRSGFVAP